MKNAREKLAKQGRLVGPLRGEPKKYSGLGTTETVGRRVIPWGTFLSNGEHVGGALSCGTARHPGLLGWAGGAAELLRSKREAGVPHFHFAPPR